MLLDIYMPYTTGIELAVSLRQRNDACEIIFLTTSSTHAIDAFALDATHYILKPYSSMQFEAALDKAFSQLVKRKQALITVKSSLGMHKVLFADILYVETEKHIQNIHLCSGVVVKIRMTSTELFHQLVHDSRFYKCGSTYILNLGNIKEVTVRYILLDTEEKLHMLRRQYTTLLDRYTCYSVKGE